MSARAACLIVGESPFSAAFDLLPPLHPSDPQGERLARLCGVDSATYLRLFDRINVLSEWPGETIGGGNAFPILLSRQNAPAIREAMRGHQCIVLLGRRVESCLGFNEIPQREYFSWWLEDLGGANAFVCVAPSMAQSHRSWSHPPREGEAKRFWVSLASRAEANLLKVPDASDR